MTAVISVAPPYFVYSGSQYQSLVDRTRELAEHTSIRDAIDTADLLMRPDGTLMPTDNRAPYRFTTPGLKQVCNLLAPGLHNVVDSLSGAIRVAGEPNSAYSLPEAVQIYNAVLRRRFDARLRSRARLIWNTHDHLLEGAYGTRYMCLQNHQMLELAMAAGSDMRFTGAMLLGRRMLLRLLRPGAVFSITRADGTVDEYVVGLYFHNSELGGETSVRMATLISRVNSDLYAMSDFTGARLSHAGRDFRSRLRSAMASLLERISHIPTRVRHMQAAARRSLGVTTLDMSDSRNTALVNYLRARDVPIAVARRIIHNTITYGSSSIAQGGYLDPRAIQSRTVYDLISTLMREAQLLSFNSRERVEQLAYKLSTTRSDSL